MMSDQSDSDAPPATVSKPERVVVQLFIAIGIAVLLVLCGFIAGRMSSESHDEMMHGGKSAHRATMGNGAKTGAAATAGSMAGMNGMSGMEGMSVTSEAEFLSQMIPHHEEAIESAKVLKAGTNRPEMRAFATSIITTQQAEVDNMRSWLAKWYPDTKVSTDYQPMMRSDLAQLKGDELDKAFLTDMAGHHMMAVHMARSLLEGNLDNHAEVATLAASIRDGQMKEIGQMQDWLDEWFDVRITHQDMMKSMMGSS